MPRRILLLEGHPDDDVQRFGNVLADAYARGALAAGHSVKRIAIAKLDFPVLRRRDDWAMGPAVPDVQAAQQDISWAQHIVVFYPIWFGTIPALLKAFFEQVLRPGFAVGELVPGKPPGPKLLGGRSARLVVTMGMPSLVFRCFYSSGLRVMSRNLLGFAGIAPVRSTVVGSVEERGPAHPRWIQKMEEMGRRGQ